MSHSYEPNSADNSEQQHKQIQICPQYIAITPTDHNSWPSIKSKLQKLANQNYSAEALLLFIQQRYKQKGYSNVRLLRKIKTQYFWASATNFILTSLVNDSQQISCLISILNSNQNTILKLTKYQVFLILGHMLFGTFPAQLHNNDISLGPFMTVYNDEDQVTSRQVLQYRLNKLKSIAKYFCIYKKRSQQTPSLNTEIVIYQRTHLYENSLDVLGSTAKFCRVDVKIGQFYQDDRQLNKISINNVSLVQNDRVVQQPIPGHNIYNNQDLHVQERIFFSHPQLLILPLIMHEGLGKYETFIVHGAQKYSRHFAISKHTQFDFKVRYFDESQLNKIHNFKNTTHIFVHRQIYFAKRLYDIVPDIMKVCSALKYCSQIRPTSDPLVSGKVNPVKKQGQKNQKKISPHRLQIPWDIKFMVDWLAASLMKYTSFEFYVEDGIEAADLNILVKEMKDYTVRDVVGVLEEYYQFRRKDKAKLSFIQFLKDFVL